MQPLKIILALFAALFTVATLTRMPVSGLQGGTSGRVLTDDGTKAVWSTTIATGAVPSLDASKITTGQMALSRGGTGADLSATGGSGQVVKQTSSGGVFTVAALLATDLASSPASGQFLKYNGSGLAWGTATGSPGGSSNQVQYNSSGSFAGTANLVVGTNTVGAVATSTSVAPWTITGIASQTADYFDVVDSSAVNRMAFNGSALTITPASGNSIISGATSAGASLNALYNSIPSGSGTRLGVINFGGTTTGTTTAAGAAVAGYSDGAWNSTSAPGAIAFNTVTSGQTSATTKAWIRSNGDVELNGAESVLSTSVTSGFTFVPNMAGAPTGTPTSRTGNSAVVYDTSNHALWVYDGSWRFHSGGVSASYSGATATYTIANGVVLVLAGTTTGNIITLNLPSAAAYIGRNLSVIHSGPNGTIIVNDTSTSIPSATVSTFWSDGTTWYHPSGGGSGSF